MPSSPCPNSGSHFDLRWPMVSFADKGGDSTLSDEVLIELPEPSDQTIAILKGIT